MKGLQFPLFYFLSVAVGAGWGGEEGEKEHTDQPLLSGNKTTRQQSIFKCSALGFCVYFSRTRGGVCFTGRPQVARDGKLPEQPRTLSTPSKLSVGLRHEQREQKGRNALREDGPALTGVLCQQEPAPSERAAR